MTAQVRTFESGATRDLDLDKYDYDGFLSPLALEAFAAYMHKHRRLPDGSLRSSDNWKQGIPLEAYAKSEWRHHMDFFKLHHGLPAREGMVDTLCALWFNVQGYLHEYLKNGAGQPAHIVDTVRLSQVDIEALLDPRPGAIMRVPDGDTTRVSSFGGITASVPPYASRDADDPMGLTAGSAHEEQPENYGGTE